MNFPDWLVNPFRIVARNRELQATLSRTRAYAEQERRVLIDEIERRKHMTGVQQKLFAGLDVFHNMLSMVQESLARLLDSATQNTKYATVAEIEAVKVAHLLFKMNVFNCFIQSTNPCKPGDSTCTTRVLLPLPSYKESEFGLWYYGTGQKLANHEIFRLIETPLINMHIFAEEAIDLFNEAQYLQGVDKVTEMEQASMEILESLESLAVSLLEVARHETASDQQSTTAPAADSAPAGSLFVPGFNYTEPGLDEIAIRHPGSSSPSTDDSNPNELREGLVSPAVLLESTSSATDGQQQEDQKANRA